MLNRGKGPAVWSPRAQCDRGLYRRAVRSELERHERVALVQGTVSALVLGDGGRRVVGVETLEGRRFGARATVVTTGTFLRGRLHIGTDRAIGGGRAGDAPATHLAEQLEAVGAHRGSLQDGNAAAHRRALGGLLGARRAGERAGGLRLPVEPLHGSRGRRVGAAAPCWTTYLEDAGKAVIAEHLGESAMYGGAIAGRGPRYCPSVEDKILRFPDAARHQLFLEPEGLETRELYVNGLSTSLPTPVQLRVLRTVRGWSTRG
jgi:tRNA uridine 5-carboxymethylaminomethyl modification enzyme